MAESSAQYTLRSSRVVLPSGIRPARIVVSNGLIESIDPYDSSTGAPGTSDPAPRIHDLGDLVVMSGLVDTHVHVNEPGRTDWEGFQTATSAAAAGGITTIVDMPLNSVPATTDVAALQAKREAAGDQLRVDVAFWGGLVPGNTADLTPLSDAGVSGFKCFLLPSGVDEFPAATEADLRGALPILAERKMPLLVHAESPAVISRLSPNAPSSRTYDTWMKSRPPEAELEAIDMLVGLCREFQAHIHIVHLAASAALPRLRAARLQGLPLTVETCPHYLTFAADEVPDGATAFKCAPPMRDRANLEALWKGLADSDIDLVASDHSPCPPSMKEMETGDFLHAWGGVASLEVSLAAVWTGMHARGVPLARLSMWMSGMPAWLAGVADRKGRLAPGLDADLVVWDPDTEFTVDPRRLHQRHKITPYAGRRLRGVVHETYVRGNLVYRHDADPQFLRPPIGVLLERTRY